MKNPTIEKIKRIVESQGLIHVHKYKHSHWDLKNLCNRLKREGYFTKVKIIHNNIVFYPADEGKN